MDAGWWTADQRRLREAVRARRRTEDRRSNRAPGRAVSRDVSPQDTPTAATPEAHGAPLASVIVVCWNSGEVLGRCLDQLFAQDYASFEIVVVDDGSSDDTVEVAEAAQLRGELAIVRSSRNRGCPHARNMGLRHAKGEIVAFIDADGFATRSWPSR